MKTRAPLYIVVSFVILSVIGGSRTALSSGFNPPVPPPAIEQQARVVLTMLESGQVDAAKLALVKIISDRRAAGIQNLTPVAAAWIGMFDEGTSNTTDSKRRELAETAIDLAPDYPGVYFLLARVRLDDGFGGLGPAVGSFIEGAVRIPHFPRTAVIYAANKAFYLQGVLIILFIIGAFAYLFRYFALFRHDLGDIFPGSVTTHFTALDIRESRGGFRSLFRVTGAFSLTLIAVLLIVAPFVLGFGLLVTAALWMFLSFPYAGRSERVVALLATVIIAGVPLAGSVTALPGRIEGSAGAMRWTCLNEYCPASYLSELETMVVSPPGDAPPPLPAAQLESYLAVAAGNIQWADGDVTALRNVRLILEGSAEAMASADGRVMYGNLLILESLASCPDGHPDRDLLASAVKSYETATVLAPAAEPVFRGLAVANGLLRNQIGMDTNLQSVLESSRSKDMDFIVRVKTATADSEACSRYDEIAAELRPPDYRSDVSVFFGGQVPFAALMAAPPRIPFKALLFGTIPPSALPFVLFGLIVLGFILAILIPRSRRAYRCQTCGHVTCPSCNRLASGFDHCPVCLFDKVKPSFLDPEDVHIMKSRWGTGGAGRILTVVLSIVVPGSGQLISGKPLRGMTMLMILGLGLELVLFPEFPVVDSFAYVPPSSVGLPILPPVLLVLAWGWSVADVLISRGK